MAVYGSRRGRDSNYDYEDIKLLFRDNHDYEDIKRLDEDENMDVSEWWLVAREVVKKHFFNADKMIDEFIALTKK